MQLASVQQLHIDREVAYNAFQDYGYGYLD